MSTDLKQFHEAFFEESLEAVDDMETGLLNLDVNNVSAESINTIFRGAHSIKGCSATFGFDEISEFVHVMETVLDEMRDGSIKPTETITDMLLKALDALRAMITTTRDEQPLDREHINTIHNDLKTILENDEDEPAKDKPKNIPDNEKINNNWEIVFQPQMNIMKTGNDPLRMFSVLGDMGELEVQADISHLLDFRTIDPDDCYISWKLYLTGPTDKETIEEVFEWVIDDCTLDIKPVNRVAVTSSLTNTGSSSSAADKPTSSASSSDAASIRVGIDKVDEIINMVGELVITQSMLDQLGEEFSESGINTTQSEKLRAGLIQLERHTRELQDSVMRIRMLPISYVFNRVPRIVHDLSNKLNKEVNVVMTGENTELDKTVLEKIGDPLVHLIRNALDHGIETPEQRRATGKPESGTIHLHAYQKGGNIIIEINDDGAGINKNKIIKKARQRNILENEDSVSDEQIYDLIFHAGLSTADIVSDVSGRGVGMDVVKKNIKALGGSIEVQSTEGEGTSFTIRLPLTLAILNGQLVRVGSETYIIPLVSIIESLQVNSENINLVAGQAEVYQLRDEYIPFVRLNELFGVESDNSILHNGLMVIVESDGKRTGLIVDDLLAQQQVVIKSLETNFKRVEGLSGATILGDGTIALIVDITGLIELSHNSHGPAPINPGSHNGASVAA